MSKYLITGATGNTGKPIAEDLLKEQHEVHILGRSKEKARELINAGAIFHEGNLEDENSIAAALENIDAAYLMIPPNYQAEQFTEYQIRIADNYRNAVISSGLKKAIILSSVGAHLKEGAGVVQGLHFFERNLQSIEGLDLLILRPTYFLENGLGMAGLAKNMGIIGSPVDPTVKIPMVATKDIADFAINALKQLQFEGKTIEYILGKRDYTYNELAGIYGKKIGKPDLQYVQFSFEDARKSLITNMGLSEDAADKFTEFALALNEGRITEQAKRTASNTTDTSAEDFSDVFKHVYEHS